MESESEQVIIDHDGGVDDFTAFSLLLVSPSCRVAAITVCPADSYREPATTATRRIAEFLQAKDVSIAAGDFEGVNPFPTRWRKDSYRVAELPLLTPKGSLSSVNVEKESAADLMVRKLSRGKYVLLTTGPLTNLAEALRKVPSIQKNVRHLYLMGGAVRVKGNVEYPGHDGSAEWNIFNNPPAADVVFRSGIDITMVPLDATNKVLLTRNFLDRLKAQAGHPVSQLWFQIWDLVTPYLDEGTYYFWDTLTSASVVKRDLIRVERMKIKIVTEGPSQGRTVESPGGNEVEVAVDADPGALEDFLLAVARR